jgi:choline dehydrogenase-like flavoprotein
VLPYFKRLERRIGDGDATCRDRDGALTVTDINWSDPLCDAFIESAVSLGIPRNLDYNGAIQEGVSYAQRTIRNGRRVSAATAFLKPGMKRGNVTVRTHAHATELLLEGKRAVGVRYAKGGRGGEIIDVRARKEVILAGGAYNSPFEAPIIQTNYLKAEFDRRVVVAGMKLARRLLAAAPLAPYCEREDFPGPGVQSDDEFLDAATRRGQTTFHSGCTCRMGPASAPNAVVDDELRVHGLDALRMISANLNASTLMIADKASDLIRGRAAPEPVEGLPG